MSELEHAIEGMTEMISPLRSCVQIEQAQWQHGGTPLMWFGRHKRTLHKFLQHTHESSVRNVFRSRSFRFAIIALQVN